MSDIETAARIAEALWRASGKRTVDWLDAPRREQRKFSCLAMVALEAAGAAQDADEVERLRAENKRVRAEMIRTSEENRRLREDTGDLRAVIAQLQDDLSSRVMGNEAERLRAFEAAHIQLQAALDTAIRERDEARAALKPFAALFLWPDDVGDEWTVNSIRSGEDWSDEQNDAQLDDKWVRRGDIRSARKALEAKS